MGKKFGKIPAEVKVQSGLKDLAPAFRLALVSTVSDMKSLGHRPRIFETLRTKERQAHIYGFGRDYDDGRGIVTHASSHLSTWHGYGLAADVVEDDATPWNATPQFWNDLGVCAEKHGLTWGGRWTFVDLPHVQWGKCRRSPSDNARFILQNGGVEAVWKAVNAL